MRAVSAMPFVRHTFKQTHAIRQECRRAGSASATSWRRKSERQDNKKHNADKCLASQCGAGGAVGVRRDWRLGDGNPRSRRRRPWDAQVQRQPEVRGDEGQQRGRVPIRLRPRDTAHDSYDMLPALDHD